MAERTKSLEELIKELPEELHQEVEDFVEFLVAKRRRKRRHFQKPKLDWRGALRDMRDEYTSVELQHKIAEWRDEDAT